MDFLPLFFIYVILFSALVVLYIYRDRPLLKDGIVGYLRKALGEILYNLIPQRFIDAVLNFVHYVLYKRSHFFQLVFGVGALVIHIMAVWDMVPILYYTQPHTNHILMPIVALFTNLFFFHLSCTSDPGEITSSNLSKFKDVYKVDGIFFQPRLMCKTCKLVKPARSKHCSICDRCVHRFDHHCIWTNNDVGAGNHRYFVLYLVTLMLMMMQGAYSGIRCLGLYANHMKLFDASYMDDDGSIKPVTFLIIMQNLFLQYPRLVFLVVSLLALVAMVGVFTVYHLYLLLTNQTTNENYKSDRLARQYQGDLTKQEKQLQNTSVNGKLPHSVKSGYFYRQYRPYDRGYLNNVLEVLLPEKFMAKQKKS